MRPFGKVLTVLFVVTYMVAIAEFFVYPAMAKGDKRADKAPSTMPAGYMNAALQRAQNMGQAKKQGEAVVKGKENAKWSQNPKDERGQGNMGKPRMRDPYGFDKDSGRIGSERGRRIEATLDLEGITNAEFTITDAHLVYLYALYEYWLERAETHPSHPYAYALAQQTLGAINRYTSYDHEYIVTGPFAPTYGPSKIEYTLTFTPPEEFEGTKLLVTTFLTSVNDYDGEEGLHYDAGQVVLEQTQEVILGTDNTVAYSYSLPADLVDNGIGFTAELGVTITDPISGASHTINYDQSLFLYRWFHLAENW